MKKLIQVLVMIAMVLGMAGIAGANDLGGDNLGGGSMDETDTSLGFDVATSMVSMTIDTEAQQVTFYNPSMAPCSIGGLRLVRENKNGTKTDLLQMPYNLLLEWKKSAIMALDVPVAPGDKVMLTNGVGVYSELTVP